MTKNWKRRKKIGRKCFWWECTSILWDQANSISIFPLEDVGKAATETSEPLRNPENVTFHTTRILTAGENVRKHHG
jgi:hypothetical protein